MRETTIARRRFIGGLAALGASGLLVACGDSDGGGSSPTTTTADDEALGVLRMFGDGTGTVISDGRPQRMPWGLANRFGPLVGDDTPAAMTAIITLGGAQVGSPVEVARHDVGVPVPYYPVTATFDEPGLYDLRFEFDGTAVDSSFTVVAPEDTTLLQPGQSVPAVDTPTTADARGVDPICTRAEEICPFHDVTLSEVLGTGPVVLLVSTPAYCQTAVCGPVLDLLIEETEAFSSITAIHAEVYTNPEDNLEEVAPIVDALGLPFEPSLLTIDASGAVVRRIDNVYDRGELAAALAEL